MSWEPFIIIIGYIIIGLLCSVLAGMLNVFDLDKGTAICEDATMNLMMLFFWPLMIVAAVMFILMVAAKRAYVIGDSIVTRLVQWRGK